MSSTITCNKCFREFEFTEKERNWYAEMGFKEPKKCKKCKDFQKNKKVYTYIPSQKELELKEKMKTKTTNKAQSHTVNVFNVLEVDELGELKQPKKWGEDDGVMDWSKPIKWAK